MSFPYVHIMLCYAYHRTYHYMICVCISFWELRTETDNSKLKQRKYRISSDFVNIMKLPTTANFVAFGNQSFRPRKVKENSLHFGITFSVEELARNLLHNQSTWKCTFQNVRKRNAPLLLTWTTLNSQKIIRLKGTSDVYLRSTILLSTILILIISRNHENNHHIYN